MAISPASEIFRHNVRVILNDKKLSISAAAAEMGISRPGLSNVLSGKEGLTFERAETIANYLGYELSQLIIEKIRRQPA